MISKSHKGVPVLQIDNLHTSECGAPPTVDATGKFVSYFENGFGEQWVYCRKIANLHGLSDFFEGFTAKPDILIDDMPSTCITPLV